MSKTFQNQRTFFLLGVLFSFSVAVIYGVGLEVPVISDEVVTLANGEFLLGNDWSYLVAATGSLYYKWFYGVFVMPILWAFHNPYIAYRIIMIINGLLQASMMPVCYLIWRRHLGLDQTLYAVLISICVTFVPSAFLYSFYARGDIFLNVIPWFVLLSLLEGMKADREARKAKKAIFTLVATVLSMIAFLAHVRGVVVIIAMVLTALLVRLFIKRSPINWMLLIVMLLILFVADSAISAFFKGALYWVEGTRANTLENMPLTSFFDIFSFGMLKDMIAMLSAWGFTLFSTSYGLVPLGVLACAAVCISAFLKKTKIKDAEKLAAIFSLLVFVGYIMVGLLLFKGTFYALKYGDLDRRVDRLLYDRYSYCGISLVVFWAVYAIAVRPERLTGKLRLVTLVLSTATLGMFFWKCYPLAVRFPGYLYNTITLNTFSEIEDPWEILWGGFYTSRMLFGALALGGGGFLLSLLFSGRRHS
ncbi:MAG: hypothetical protein IJ709_01235, partial [Selenomonas sp.]|nr:hypothetical protein [Selenomonas sp.]